MPKYKMLQLGQKKTLYKLNKINKTWDIFMPTLKALTNSFELAV